MQCYTYRNGQRCNLVKQPGCFVIRALNDHLSHAGLPTGEQVSTASTRIFTEDQHIEGLMARGRGIAPTHHGYLSEEDGNAFLITDRVMVTFQPNVAAAHVNQFMAKYALMQRRRFSDGTFLFQLTNYTGMNPIKLVVAVTENEQEVVALIEHDLNYTAHATQTPIPHDPRYRDQWHLHQRTQHPEFDPRASARCEQAWQRLASYGDETVVVGVTDDGCDMGHHDFNSTDKFAGWGYFQNFQLITQGMIGAQPARMYSSGNNHGTSCAGVIAGEVDGTLTVGAAPACKLLPIKWPLAPNGGMYIGDTRLMEMLEYIEDKVDIVSNSWGNSPSSNVNLQVFQKITELTQTGGRRGKGILFLWAAGNENCPIHHQTHIDVPYSHGWQRVGNQFHWIGPKTAQVFRHNLTAVDGVLYIAALASTAKRSHYSNYGTGIDLCAPSSNSHAYFRADVAGLGITTTSGGPNNAVTDQFGGTSSATPLTAGIAALVISANPELSAHEVAALLKRTASKDLNFDGYPKTLPTAYDPNPDWDVSPIAPFASGAFTDTGAPEGTWSPWFGHGRVDALEAVEAALASRPPEETPPPEKYPEKEPKPSKDT